MKNNSLVEVPSNFQNKDGDIWELVEVIHHIGKSAERLLIIDNFGRILLIICPYINSLPTCICLNLLLLCRGHYITFIKHDAWTKFDDRVVSKGSPWSDEASSYILGTFSHVTTVLFI